MRYLLIFILGLCFLTGCGVPLASGPSDTYGIDFTPPAGSGEVRGVIVFVVDGVNGTIFQQMMDAGELPALKRYFVDRGLYVTRASAGTPSITLANLTSLVTGYFPGHNNIPSITWFDRNEFLCRNYNTIAQKNTLDGDYKTKTIFERFPQDFTVSIFYQAHRGASKFFENVLSAAAPYTFGWYDFVDRLTLFRFGEMMMLARQRGQFPLITYVYMLNPDFQAYAHGVSSEQYRQALRHTDFQLGRVLGDLKRAGLLEKINIALVSDHGMGDVKHHFPLGKFLRRQGLSIGTSKLCDDYSRSARKAYYDKFPAVLYGNGDRFWAICLRKPKDKSSGKQAYHPWHVRPTADELRAYPLASGKALDLPDVLIAQTPIDAVAWATGQNRCIVRTKAGSAEFSQPAGPRQPIAYRAIKGDPFGWRGKLPDEVLAGNSMTPRQWLEMTNETTYPALPAQILAYFRASRAGDIAVFATPGWDFHNTNNAGHGGLRSEDLHVPLLLAGPGVPHKQIKTARTIDLVPTLIELLGEKAPQKLDGQSLLASPDNPQD